MPPETLYAVGVLAFSIAWLILFGFFLPAEYSVLAFVGLWIIFPNWATPYASILDLPLYFYVEIGATIAIAVLPILRSKPADCWFATSGGRWLVGLLWLSILVQYAVAWPLEQGGYRLAPTAPTALQVANLIRVVDSAVFFYGCFRYITSLRDLRRFDLMLVLASAYLVFEYVALGPLQLYPALAKYSFDPWNGRYKSLILNDFIAVSIVCCLGSLGALTRAWSRRSIAWLVAAVVLLVPVGFDLVRSTYIAFAVALVYLVFKVSGRAVGCFAAAVLIFIWVAGGSRVIGALGDSGTLDTREGRSLASTDSLYSRLGLQARALDVWWYLMPLGTGEDMLQYYMAAPQIGPIFPVENEEISRQYSDAALGVKETYAHNFVLETVVSYSFPGALWLAAVFLALRRNYHRTRGGRSLRADKEVYRLFIWQWGALLFFFVFYLYNSVPKVFVLYFFLIRCTFLFDQSGGSAARNTLDHVASRPRLV